MRNKTVKVFEVEGLRYKLWLNDHHEFVLDVVAGATKKGTPKKRLVWFWGDEPEDMYENIYGDLALLANPFTLLKEITPAIVACVYERKLKEFCFFAVNARGKIYERYARRLLRDHFGKNYDLICEDGRFWFYRRAR